MAKERNDGKKIEKIVALFESVFGQEGCTVSVNDKVYDEEGNQIAEFDIIVEKPSEEKPFRWLFECRDRPSSGSAPASWIEQLIGRKARFSFDRISAVSTSGFSPGARDRAKFGDIELREMNELLPEKFSEWLSLYYQHLLSQHFELVNVQFYTENPKPEIDAAVLKALQASTTGELNIFYLPFHNLNVTASQLLDGILAQNHHIGRDMPTEDSKINISIEAKYDNPEDPVTVNTELGNVRILKLVFETVLTSKVIKSPIWASEYRIHQENATIAEVGTTKYDVNGQEISVQMIKPSDGDGSSFISVTTATKI